MPANFSELDLLRRFPFTAATTDSSCLVDVGAHQGGVTIPFARRGWRVIAFEPEPRNRSILLKRVGNMKDVAVLDNAVSDVPGQEVPFYASDEHTGIHTLKPFHKTHKPAGTVATVRLDTTLTEAGVTDVSLLKIDIEGADFLALKSFDFDRYRPEIVMVEFMDSRSQKNYDYSHHDMAAFMVANGYKTYLSEWSPITHYARPGQATGSRWLQIVPYPLDHDPAWGNLIFVLNQRSFDFEATLASYLVHARRQAWLRRLPGFVAGRRLLARVSNLPGLRGLKNLIRSQ